MNKLQSQFQRLYCSDESDLGEGPLIDQHGRVRALVVELAKPADWDTLSILWRGVQADLDLCAPAIAVSGSDGLQLWFSLVEPVSIDLARAFLQSLCTRYLPDVAASRMRLMPADGAQCVPALHERSGYWSAFVTAELAPLFADTPWIDSQPSSDGQAGVLSRLLSIAPPAFAAALRQLGLDTAVTGASALTTKTELVVEPARYTDAKRFLQHIMNDDSVPLALRIEAAKALLPYQN